MLGLVLAHIVILGASIVLLVPQDLPQLLQFLNSPLLLEHLQFLLPWEDRQLERNVELVLLLTGSLSTVGLSIPEAN